MEYKTPYQYTLPGMIDPETYNSISIGHGLNMTLRPLTALIPEAPYLTTTQPEGYSLSYDQITSWSPIKSKIDWKDTISTIVLGVVMVNVLIFGLTIVATAVLSPAAFALQYIANLLGIQ